MGHTLISSPPLQRAEPVNVLGHHLCKCGALFGKGESILQV